MNALTDKKYAREKMCSGALATATATATASSSSSLPVLPPGEEIYDLMPPVWMAFPWWEWFGKAFLVLLAVIALYKFYNWLISEPQRVRPVIRQSPQKQALRALKRLKLSPVWSQKQMKEISETLVFILKSYIKEEYEIGLGAAATSDEMLVSLKAQNTSSAIIKEVRELFGICDRIKFTGIPCDADAEKMADIVEQLLHKKGWQT
jgi:hypothetical protein